MDRIAGTVGSILPAMTRVAWQIKKQELRKGTPSLTRKTFLYNLSRSSYEKNWGATYSRPGIRSKFLATLFRITPKVGRSVRSPLQTDTETEKLYMASVNSTIDFLSGTAAEVDAGNLKLSNDNLDVGTLTAAGKYRLTDAAYSELLDKLDGHYTEIPQELRSDILAFYHDRDAPISTGTNRASGPEYTKN